VAEPQLYRAVFMEPPVDADDLAVGWAAVERPIATICRCVESGRFHAADTELVGRQVWACAHGMLSGLLVRLLSADEAMSTFTEMAITLYVGFGDERGSARRSLRTAAGRIRATRHQSKNR
jgi:hypothetical protein